MNIETQNALDRLKASIEKELAWNRSEHWTHHEFSKLSEILKKQTGIALNPMTLKRLWGKVKSSSQPSINTLNALSMYLGYSDWQQYLAKFNKNKNKGYSNFKLINLRLNKKGAVIIALIILTGLLIIFRNHIYTFLFPINNENIVFKIEQPANYNIPTTIRFYYSIPEKYKNRKFYAVHNDIKVLLDNENNYYNQKFDLPGIKEVKLVSRSQVLRSVRIQTMTEGWVAVIPNVYRVNKIIRPVYINQDDLISDGEMKVPVSFAEKQIDFELFITTNYMNFSDFSIDMDEIIFETRIKYLYTNKKDYCQNSHVTLIDTEQNMISLRLNNPSCNISSHFIIDNKLLNSENKKQLSQFSINMLEYHNVTIKTVNSSVFLYLDNELIFEKTYETNFTNLHGIRIHFEGNGAVDYVRLRDKNKDYVLNNDFEADTSKEGFYPQ